MLHCVMSRMNKEQLLVWIDRNITEPTSTQIKVSIVPFTMEALVILTIDEWIRLSGNGGIVINSILHRPTPECNSFLISF